MQRLGYKALPSTNGYSGYNQTNTHPNNAEMIVFQSPKGVFCSQFMPFLKNAEATYQRVMIVIFKEMLRDTVECYVDDLIIKSLEDRPLRTTVLINFVNTS